MAKHVRSLEPKGIRISLGGEIGHIGGVNSTVEDFRAFIDGFNKGIGGREGISKVAVQTGSSHGGVVLPDGSLADVEVDFSILKNISKVARNEFQIGGPVQHGASTLPEEYFSEFVKNEALEVHLATGFQNTQMDHPEFPQDLRKKIYEWLDSDLTEEKKEDQTVDQFHYKLRKKGWGRFKKETWDIPETSKAAIRDSLAERFEFLFQQLNVIDTADLVSKFVKPISISKPKNDFSLTPPEDPNEVKGLAD
jgi:hypothetical protein